ncbi:MAG TPA: hypothetical protein PKV71_15415, partial [Calditrichia bacterium]|nr:hypothetical protein [Calditrichia bacterium]
MSTSLEFLRANPTALFEYVLAHYFRRHSPFTPTLSFTFLDSQPVKVRRIIAASSNSPDVLEHLAGDIDPWTRETARRSRYWLFLGQFRQLIEMNRRDKIRFIQNEPFTSILPFVVFDTDPEVLGAALENPNISIKMLLNLDRFLDEKSPTMPDRQLRDLVKRVIAIRRNRVLKVSTIFSAVNHTRSGRTTLALFPLLLDRDNLIRKSAIRAIQRLTPEELKSALGYQSEMAELVREGTVFVWHLLRELPVLYNQPDADLQAWIADQKTVLLDHCLSDLSHHRNLQTL